MKRHLITLGLFVAVIGLAGGIYYEDRLFAVSFLWSIVYGFTELIDNDKEE